MNKIKLACIASILATGLANAAPCDGFEIKVKNNLADDLLVTKLDLNGAQIQPGGLQKLSSHSEEVFTVSKSSKDADMIGNFVFRTVSLPSKTVNIQFDLHNSTGVCEHSDKEIPSDYNVDKTRILGKGVNYTINNK